MLVSHDRLSVERPVQCQLLHCLPRLGLFRFTFYGVPHWYTTHVHQQTDLHTDETHLRNAFLLKFRRFEVCEQWIKSQHWIHYVLGIWRHALFPGFSDPYVGQIGFSRTHVFASCRTGLGAEAACAYPQGLSWSVVGWSHADVLSSSYQGALIYLRVMQPVRR